METYIVWWQVFLKQQLKKKLYWLQILLMIAGIWSIGAVSFPNADNCSIGYCYERQPEADWLAEGLEKQDAELDFFSYNKKAQLCCDVVSGKIDCGFVLPAYPGIGTNIECVSSPMSTKSALARLTVFCVCYRIRSEEILSETYKMLYTDIDKVRMQFLLDKNRQIRESDQVFDIRIIEVPIERSATNEKQQVMLPVQGVAGIFVMMIILLAHSLIYEPDRNGVLKALPAVQRRRMRMLYSLSAGMLPAIIAPVMLGLTGHSRGIGTEFFAVLLLVLWSQVWALIAGKWQRTSEHYYVEFVLFLMVQLIICPVFTNLTDDVPALALVRLFFPLGIYTYF